MKKRLDVINVTYPMPTVLVGATVNGKPNFITMGHTGILNHAKPQLVSLGMNKAHYTNRGIWEHKTFSLNMPSENLVVETDYVGLYSGHKHDKSALFTVFYGQLETAPMISECLVCAECKLHDVYDTPTHDVFIGEIVETYVEDSVLTDDSIDIAKLKPVLFDWASRKYWSLGGELAKAWSVGKDLKMGKD
jgi:flavin reductase (DIM6/NTAB) family NADH-FMN oxidoreductase RutF